MFDIEALIQYGGLAMILLAIYVQTGLVFCFFIPSGAFLFTGGVFIANGVLDYNLFTLCSLSIVASSLGNLTGYLVGMKTGTYLYHRPDTRFFNRQHLLAAEGFYKKYGASALSIGAFLPLIRTFGPILAGIIKLPFGHFATFVFIGSTGWILSIAFAGYLIGSMPFLKPYLDYVVVSLILLVTVPIAVKIIRAIR